MRRRRRRRLRRRLRLRRRAFSRPSPAPVSPPLASSARVSTTIDTHRDRSEKSKRINRSPVRETRAASSVTPSALAPHSARENAPAPPPNPTPESDIDPIASRRSNRYRSIESVSIDRIGIDRSNRYRSIESVSIESIASTDRPASPRSLPTDTPRARSSPPSRARDDAVVVPRVRARANEIHRCARSLDDVRARGLLVPRARSPPGRRVASKSRPTHPSRIVRARKTSSRRRARERERGKNEKIKRSRIASRCRPASRTVVVVLARVILRRRGGDTRAKDRGGSSRRMSVGRRAERFLWLFQRRTEDGPTPRARGMGDAGRAREGWVTPDARARDG